MAALSKRVSDREKWKDKLNCIVTSLRDLVFRELLPVFAGSPRDLGVKANLTPGTVSDQSFSACFRQSVSFTVVRTADVSFCSCRGLLTAST